MAGSAGKRLTGRAQAAGRARLDALSRLAEELPRLSWFAAVGEPLLESERDDALSYLGGLGMEDRKLLQVRTWAEAAAAAAAPDWEPGWWALEEAERKRLESEAAAALGEEPLLSALSQVTQQATTWLLGAAALAAARSGQADPALTRVAAGAAAQAAFHEGLRLAAGAPVTQVFAAKFRLYAAGRWPLAVTKRGFYLF